MIKLVYILLLALVIIVRIYRGSDDPYFCAFVFKCKLQICIQVGGSLIYIFMMVLVTISLQIHMLSSNTRKGETEMEFPYEISFGVC
jgi:hypothetical protein